MPTNDKISENLSRLVTVSKKMVTAGALVFYKHVMLLRILIITLLFYCLSAKLSSIITKMKLQNIEKTKKKRKKRKNKTDTIKLIRKRANVQLNSNPKEALAIKRQK